MHKRALFVMDLLALATIWGMISPMAAEILATSSCSCAIGVLSYTKSFKYPLVVGKLDPFEGFDTGSVQVSSVSFSRQLKNSKGFLAQYCLDLTA